MNRTRSAILTYHSLDASGSVISIHPSVFRKHLEALRSARIPVVPLTEVLARPGALALTFDDGFRNFHEAALPLLQEFGYPATVFVVTGYCGRANDWPSQPSDVPYLDLMSWSELRECLRYGVTIGAHTVTHPRLTFLDSSEAAAEIARSRKTIEQRLGIAVREFSYPYGECNPALEEIAGRHFEIACGTTPGWVTPHTPRRHLPRIDAYYVRNPFWIERLATSTGSAYIAARRGLRDLRRMIVTG